MADLAKITLPSGTTYDLKDQGARDLIQELMNYTDYLGVTTTELVDGVTTSANIVINGETVTAVAGNVATYNSDEFIYASTGVWQKFANLSGLGALAHKDSASTTYTPTGSVSQPTFSGTELTSTGKITPAGTVAAPTISLASAGSTDTVNSITDVGTLPSCTLPTYTVENETLTITAGSFSTGTLPTKGEDLTVKVGDATYSASAPAFTGTEGNISVKGTPSGTVSQPTFSGNQATITVQ